MKNYIFGILVVLFFVGCFVWLSQNDEMTTDQLEFVRYSQTEIRATYKGRPFCGYAISPHNRWFGSCDLVDIIYTINNYGKITELFLYHPHPAGSECDAVMAFRMSYYPNLDQWRDAEYYDEYGNIISKQVWIEKYGQDFSRRLAKTEHNLWEVLFKDSCGSCYPMCMSH